MEKNIKVYGNTDKVKAKEYLKKGKKLFEKNKVKQAFKNFDKAIELDEDYDEAYLVKGEANIEMFELDKAEKCIKKYADLVQDKKRAYLDLIEIYDGKAEFESAIEYCDKLLCKDPKNIDLYLKKAEFFKYLGYIQKSLECYNTCIKLNPNLYEALCDKAEILNDQLERHEEALDIYSKAIEIDSTKSDAYLGKAFVYKDIGDLNNALKFAKKAYEIDPEDEWCKSQYCILDTMFRMY